ncbi:MAG: hypothetical protein ABIS86_13345 [Streptosporangiaceae bacterium]
MTHRSQAGVVYAAVDAAGRQVSVVVLTRGAASDAAARDRFAAAIRDDPGSLLAADPANAGPWAAGPGAARLLDSVQLAGPDGAEGPGFQHHWAGWDDPAFPSYGRAGAAAGTEAYPEWKSAFSSGAGSPGEFVTWGSASRVTAVGAAPERPDRRGGWWAVLVLVLLFLVVAMLLWWLYSSQPDPDDRPPVAPTPTSAPSPSTSGPRSPGTATPSPSGSQSAPTRTPGSTGPSGTGPSGPGSGEPDDPL